VLPPLKADTTPAWLRHLHWLLALALIPLAVSLLENDKTDLKSRLEKTYEEATEEEQERIDVGLAKLAKDLQDDPEKVKDAREVLFELLPDQKLSGALLSRRTWAHWGFAAGAVVVFLAFLLFLAADGTASPGQMLGIGLFTATVGILFLFAVQAVAAWSQGVWPTRGGVFVIVIWLVKLIGFSYRAAMEADNGFLLSFIGYTLGVGFCEEVCKALPLLWHYRQPSQWRWRTAFLWGLASGAGFGIAEGVIYSRDFYNGSGGLDIYLVRFLSCVALHAVWTGSVAVTLHRRQELIQREMPWYEYIPPLYLIVGVPMVLHGLYDTFLKKDMSAAALVVAVASFLFLAFQISRLGSEDDAAANERFLRDYKRRRAATG
jgi:RsiW-degrading membrane proteinase PrsW (M82 family)